MFWIMFLWCKEIIFLGSAPVSCSFSQYCFPRAPLRDFSWPPCKLCNQWYQRALQFCWFGVTFRYYASLQLEIPLSHGVSISISAFYNDHRFLPSHSSALGSAVWQKALSVPPLSSEFPWVWVSEAAYTHFFGSTASRETVHFFCSSCFQR